MTPKGRKVGSRRLAKAAGAEPCGQMRDESCTPLWRGGSESRLAKAAGAEPCGQMRDEKLHAGVARSTFPSQHV